MSSIHYKFRATVELKTVRFDGLHILCSELKREIYNNENIRVESFDLVLTNAQTRRSYLNDEPVPRNATIIVQRIPKEGAEKAPKIPKGNGGLILKNGPSTSGDLMMNPDVIGHLDPAELEKMSEEERQAHMMSVSTSKYQPSNYVKRVRNTIMSGPPPPTYVCNRCNQTGHWYQNCPMANTKKATGMTMDELIVTTADDPHALLHSSGRYVVPKMHHLARQLKSQSVQGSASPSDRLVPVQLTCPICKELLKNAMITTCCSVTFCDECISNELIESEDRQCPKCGKTGLSLDTNLIPNAAIRDSIREWISSASTHPDSVTSSPNIENEAPVGVQRVRIGLGPSAPSIQPAIRDLNTPAVSAMTMPQATTAVSQTSLAPPVQPMIVNQIGYAQMQPSLVTQATIVPPQLAPQLPATSHQPSLSSSLQNSLLPPGVDISVRPPFPTQFSQPLAPPGVPVSMPAMNVPPPTVVSASLPSGLSAVELVQRTVIGTSNSYGMNLQTAAFSVPGGPVPGQNNLDQWNQFLARKDQERRTRAREGERKRRKERRRSSSSESSRSSSGSWGDRRRFKHDPPKRRRDDDYHSRRRSPSREKRTRVTVTTNKRIDDRRGKRPENRLDRAERFVQVYRYYIC